ncbi:MAG: class A beta-lactamase [Parvularcula sp.]
MTLSRRQTLAGLSAVMAGGCTTRAGQTASGWFDEREAALGSGHIGVFALNLRTGKTIAHRADKRFAMTSTFKWVLAAFVLKDLSDGPHRDHEPMLTVRREDLVPYAPLTEAALGDRDDTLMTVKSLCIAAVSISDNVAANILLRTIDGPEGFTARCRAIGDDVTRLDRWEPALNENKPGDPRDTTTPRAMTQTMRTILFTDALLDSANRQLLKGWMIGTATGHYRLRAGFPAGWEVGDKTGTSMNGAVNDVAFARTHKGDALLVSSYINAPNADRGAAESVHAQIAARAAEMLAG